MFSANFLRCLFSSEGLGARARITHGKRPLLLVRFAMEEDQMAGLTITVLKCSTEHEFVHGSWLTSSLMFGNEVARVVGVFLKRSGGDGQLLVERIFRVSVCR